MYFVQALYYTCLCLCCILLSPIIGAKPLTILSLLNANLDQYNNENSVSSYFTDQSQYGPDNDLPYLSTESSEQKESRVLYYKVPQSSEVGAELFDANDNNNGYVYETYGPFPEEQVMDWWQAGYFDSSLLVSDDLAAQFIPMTTFLEEGFSSSPPPPSSPPLAATRPSDKEYEIAEILDEETSVASDESLERTITTTKLKKKGTRKKSSVLRKIAGLGRRAKQASLAFLQDSLTSTLTSVQSDQDSSSDWSSHASIEPVPVAGSRTYIADPSEHLVDEDDGHAQQGKHVSKQSKVR